LYILKKINAIFPAAKTARDIDLSILEECKSHLNEIEYCRIMHVIFENERVLQFCKYIREDDLISCGKLLNLSHESLQKLYEVSCEELDTLQQLASETSCIYGSRMMGGGFGGCTINLFESLNEDELEYILQNFNDKFKYRPEHYIVRPHSGITIHE
jgi:galactokinase